MLKIEKNELSSINKSRQCHWNVRVAELVSLNGCSTLVKRFAGIGRFPLFTSIAVKGLRFQWFNEAY